MKLLALHQEAGRGGARPLRPVTDRKIQVRTRETERGGPCRPIETEVNRDSGSTYGRVSFLHIERKAMRTTRMVHYE